MSRNPNTQVVCLPSGACSECAVDGDCAASPGRLACSSANVCVQCTKDANCSGATPICDTVNNKCVKCPTDMACVTKSTALPWCSATAGSTTLGMCVQCKVNGDCAAPNPGCSAVNTCVACTLDSHCAAATPICDKAMNKCSKCSLNAECAAKNGALPVCLAAPGNGTCVQCQANSDCSGATPGCSAANRCVACTLDSHCGGTTPICDTTANRCIPCTSDAQCKAKTSLGGNPGVCMTHVDGHCAIDAETIYVENRIGVCTDGAGGGTSAKPFCTMQGALTGLTTGKLIVVRGPVGSATSASLGVAKVSLVGQSSALIAAGLNPAARITSGDAYFRDLTLVSANDVGCTATSGSTLRMDHVSVRTSQGGILLDGAAFDIRNTTVLNNGLGPDGLSGGIQVQNLPASGPRSLSLVTLMGNSGAALTCTGAIQGAGVFLSMNGLGIATACAVTACTPAGSTCGAGPPP